MGLFSKPKHPYWVQHSHLFADDEYICSVCGCPGKKAVLRARLLDYTH